MKYNTPIQQHSIWIYLPACHTQLGITSFCTTVTECELKAFFDSTDWEAFMRRRDNKENILRVNPVININSINALLKER